MEVETKQEEAEEEEEEDEVVVISDPVDPIEHRIKECERLGLPLPPRPELCCINDGRK